MLEKVLGIAKRLASKNVLRIGLLVTTVVSVLTGFIFVDGSSVAFNGDVYMAGGYSAEDSEVLNTTVNAEDIKPELEAIESIVASPLLGMNSVDKEYTHMPLEMTVTYETVTETVKHGYETVYSDKLYKGESKTTKGQHGEKKVVYAVTVVNGVETARVVESEEITKEPKAQVITKGTKKKAGAMTSADVKSISTLKPDQPIALDKNGIPVNYTKVISGKATAYCNHCDSNSTAYFGKNTARPGYIAVNPKQIPYGTKLYIVSANGKTVYGYAIAADTGGFANSNRNIADLRFHFDDGCHCGSEWGRRQVNIYVLGK